MSIPRASVRHPVTTTMVFAALLVVGIVSLGRVGQELFPEVDLPTMVVITVSPGAAPQEVESRITRPIEEAASGINGVERVSSISFESSSQVTVGFVQGTDLGTAQVDVREALAAVEDRFPDGTEQPIILRYSASMTPTLELNVVTIGSGIDLRRLTEDEIVPAIERVPGVGRAQVFGGRERAVVVALDLDAVIKTGIPITQVLQAFGGDNLTVPAGTVDIGERSVALRTVGEFNSVDDIGALLVGYQGRVPIYLRELAEITLDYRPQEELATAQGNPAVRISIRKQPDANTVEVNDGVLAALDGLSDELPDGVSIEVQSNQADTVRDSIGGVVDAGWQGGLLAIVILLFFLRNVRSTVIIATVIPLAVIATISLIDFGGMTLNITSLMGVTLAIGMFVDNSIVVLESIYRKALAGFGREEAAVEGAEEVSKAVTASTLTSMAVFLPLLFVGGLAGELFQDLSLTIAFSLFMSLVASLSFVPMLSSRFLKVTAIAGVRRDDDHEISLADVEVRTRWSLVNWIGRGIQRALRNLDDGYERLITAAVHHRVLVIVLSVVLLAVSVGSVLLLGTEFLPVADEGNFAIEFATREGASASFTLGKAEEIEEIVRAVSGGDLRAIGGASGAGGRRTADNEGSVEVALAPSNERSRDIWEITREVDRRVQREVLDVEHRTTIVGMSSLASMASGVSADIFLELRGSDLERMREHARAISEAFRDVPGMRNVRSSADAGIRETRFVVRREEAASLGVSAREIATVLRAAYNGVEVSTFAEDSGDYDIVVILDEEDRTDLSRVNNLFLVSSAGERIPMENLVRRVDERGPVAIERDSRTRIVRVLADLDGTRPLSDVVADVDRKLVELGPAPVGVERAIEGASAEMGTSFRSLAFALLLAVALVYMVMASQFEDFVNPLIVMASVPFAVIGLVGALLVTNTNFSILAFAGGILLVGIVVNNAIVLIDYMGTLRARGLPLMDAVIKGGRTRLKPILMTSLTTILGLLPMSLGIGAGAELRYPMGRAVVGGLVTSTLITLVLIPVLYTVVEGTIKPWFAAVRARTGPSEREEQSWGDPADSQGAD
ncbi:MAG: efflux RND transporter permease subunit [Spirochaetota bacterium]